MASLEDLEDLERDHQDKQKEEEEKKKADGDDTKMDVDAEEKKKEEDDIDPDVLSSSTTDIVNRRRLLDNDLRVMKQEFQRLTHEKTSMREKIKDNLEKIENNRFVVALSGATSALAIANNGFSRIQTASLPRRKCCRASRPGPHCRRSRGWSQCRPRRHPRWQICRYQDVYSSDYLPALDWVGRPGEAQARRSSRVE